MGPDWTQTGITFSWTPSCPPVVADTIVVDTVTTSVDEVETSPLGTTVKLYLELGAEQANLYSIYASSETPAMVFPPVYNPDPLNIGVGILEQDSYLTVGEVGTSAVLSTVNIPFGDWNEDSGLIVTEGAIVHVCKRR